MFFYNICFVIYFHSLTVLSKLTSCAVTENRYNDAAHYYFLLSQQCEKLGANAENEKKIIFFEQHEKYLNLSEIYYAYHMIHRYVEEPFTNQQQVMEYIYNFRKMKICFFLHHFHAKLQQKSEI